MGANYDFSVDIWALGVLLYELVHGYSIYGGGGSNAKEKLSLTKRREEIRYKDGLSSEITDLIKGILKNDPKARLSVRQILEHPWMMKNSVKFGIDIPNLIEINRHRVNEQSLMNVSRISRQGLGSQNYVNILYDNPADRAESQGLAQKKSGGYQQQMPSRFTEGTKNVYSSTQDTYILKQLNMEKDTRNHGFQHERLFTQNTITTEQKQSMFTVSSPKPKVQEDDSWTDGIRNFFVRFGCISRER